MTLNTTAVDIAILRFIISSPLTNGLMENWWRSMNIPLGIRDNDVRSCFARNGVDNRGRYPSVPAVGHYRCPHSVAGWIRWIHGNRSGFARHQPYPIGCGLRVDCQSAHAVAARALHVLEPSKNEVGSVDTTVAIDITGGDKQDKRLTISNLDDASVENKSLRSFRRDGRIRTC
jgi:hypothetical protein